MSDNFYKLDLNSIFGKKYTITLTEHQQKEIDSFSDIPDEQKIQYNRSLSTNQLLHYYNAFNEFINSGCTKSYILHDFELLKQEIKRRLNVYDNIKSEFENSKVPIELIYRDWKELDK